MGTVADFIALLNANGSPVVFHRDTGWLACPCLTPEGFRDPEWHDDLASQMNTGAETMQFAATWDDGLIDYTKNVKYFIVPHMAVPSAFMGPMLDFLDVPADTFNVDYQTILANVEIPVIAGINGVGLVRSINDGPKQLLATVIAEGQYIDNQPISYVNPFLTYLGEECNESGLLQTGDSGDMSIKGFVQPIQSTRATRLSAEYMARMFGEIQSDDHLGIFPESWAGTQLNFYDWSQAGDEYIEYDGRRFMVVNANLIPDPDGGSPRHHWEVGLRLISERG